MTLESVPGLGPVTVEKLRKVGIESIDQLEEIGSMNAFLMVREMVDKGACLSFLYGLEGAVQKKRSKELSPDTKEKLRKFVRSLDQEQ
ncbi:TfoX/Sxy family DNA transformation protein [Enterococcus sp. BWM-S5]|uniref:TfoX/Sxy family DNA transformation protein n=1 Tax=Enterococcus larvae TaxID=2794352 RepID=A0ABS4CM70_9ENTE|nr:TfoX/Sxy family DNA transformation protein [Enterococcus larvae]MBP1047702.1 TfoX/Sxy family DNA transformation protein [Enterococcus larvae]